MVRGRTIQSHFYKYAVLQNAVQVVFPGYWLLDTDPKFRSYICAESINLVQPVVSPPEN